MRVLNARDVEAALPLGECIDAMRDLFEGLAREAFFQPLRTRIRPEGSENWLTLMPALRHTAPRLWGLKEMAVTPANASRGRDPIEGAVLLHDGEDGRLLAIVSAPALTAIRTAAVSALATRTLARPESTVVAVIGAGVQGRMHVKAMREVLPRATIRLWGRTPATLEEAARETGAEPFTSMEAAIAGADVVCTVTAAATPIVRREWFAPGTHINAVGSSAQNAREIDGATFAAASLFVDRRESTVRESGDYLGALAEGAIAGESHIQAELGDVLIGRHPGRRSSTELTLYKSLGLAVQDLVAAERAVQLAAVRNCGMDYPW